MPSRERAARPLEHGWIDVSVPLRHGMVHWPSDPPLAIERPQQICRGDTANLSQISTSVHVGTHMDAPKHFIDDGVGIDAAPLEALIGEARVVSVGDVDVIRGRDLQSLEFQRGERVLFRTRNSGRRWWEDGFRREFVAFAADAARHLAQVGVRTVGIDYLSVGGYKAPDGADVHRALLSAGVWIIEGLDLTRTEPGRYEMICLPLRLVGSDGAPARVLLRPVPAAS